MDLNCYIFADETHVSKEKQKMRQAKKQRWWHDKKSRGICHYCQKKFPPASLTMDHVVPISRGGTTTPGNIVAACEPCNKNKSVSTPVDIIFASSDV